MKFLTIVSFACVLAVAGASARGESGVTAPSDALAVVDRHRAVFTAPPAKLPSNNSTDAPLLGNGDLLAALGGAPERLAFYLSKNDLWELRPDGGPRSLAPYACLPLASTWYATYDLAFARKARPFVREVAVFWEHFLVREGERFVICDDAALENSGRNTDGIVSLALERKVFDFADDMGAALDADFNKRAIWRDMRSRMIDYPQRDGKSAEIVVGERVTLKSKPNETLGLAPI